MSPEAFEIAASRVKSGAYIELMESVLNVSQLEALAELRTRSGGTIHVILNEPSLLIEKLVSLGAYVTADKAEAVLT